MQVCVHSPSYNEPKPICFFLREINCFSLSISSTQSLTDNMVVWDCKPEKKDAPIKWVELKTSAEMYDDRDLRKYERKLLKFWAQSFLLGVPKIVVGFRSKYGTLERLEEVETRDIPGNVKRLGKGTWDGNICINFTAKFLDCMTSYPVLAYSLTASRA